MKEGWTYKKLGEVYDVRDGTHDSPKYQSKGYPLVTSKNLRDGILDMSNVNFISQLDYNMINQRSKVDVGDVLFAMIGTIGNPVYVEDEPEYAIKNMALFKVPENQSGKFLRYFLLNDNILSKMQKESKGTTQKFVSLGYLRNFIISIPTLSEQQRIVSRLDSAFAHIDELKANAEKQLSEARALFQKALNKAMEPKEGWVEKILGDLATDMYRGSGIKRDQVTREGIPCVRYGEIYTTYNIGFEECVSHTVESYISSPKYFEHGDLLFAITGESVEDIGKTIAYLGHDKCLLGGDIICMKHQQNPKFMAYALSTPDAIRQKGIGKTKLKVVHTNAPALKAISIPVPPLTEQQRIVSRLDSLSAHVRELEEVLQKTIAECDALKQALLRKVFE